MPEVGNSYFTSRHTRESSVNIRRVNIVKNEDLALERLEKEIQFRQNSPFFNDHPINIREDPSRNNFTGR